MTPTTLVGHDGSELARVVRAYAAGRTGSEGQLIVAYAVTSPVLFMDTEYYDDAPELARQFGETTMREVEDLLAGVPGDLGVLEGPPGSQAR